MNTAESVKLPVHIGPRRLCHANLFVTDLERSLAFYNEVCGFEIVMRQPSINAGFLSNGNTHHDLGLIQATADEVKGQDGHRILAAGQGAKAGLNHLGWEMESEFELTKAYQRALAVGYKINRTVRHRSSRSVYIFDPDGNMHEFYADVSKDWRTLYASKTTVSGDWTPGENPPSFDRNYWEEPEIRRLENAAVHPVRITHAALVARNYERMRDFFRNIVGLLEVHHDEEMGVTAFQAPRAQHPFVIALRRQEDGSQPSARGLHHVGFELPDEAEVEAGEREVQRRGLAVEQSIDLPSKRSFFIRDPDGILLEFYRLRSESPFPEVRTAKAADYAI